MPDLRLGSIMPAHCPYLAAFKLCGSLSVSVVRDFSLAWIAAAMLSNPMSLAFVLLIISNCFMTLAWYGHLKFLHAAPLWQAILFGWSIALLEYACMIPATRLLAAHGWSMGQMKISQEVVTLVVFVPFMLLLFKQPWKMDYLWAGLCLLGCVYFVFRSQH